MYNIGTVTTTANSTKLVGTGTKWKENINLVLPMQMIQIQIGNTVHNNSIHSIQSNTELTLNFPLPTAQAGAKYVIFTTTMDSISAAANAIVAMNVSNVQFSDIQNRIMTESGVIDIKLPDGTVRKTRTEAERDKLLDGKFDKTGGTISGDVTFSKDAIKSTKGTHTLPAESGTLMQVGDYGLGSLEATKATNSQLMSSSQSQFFKMGGGNGDNAFVSHGVGLLISYSASIRAGLFINDANGDLTIWRSRAGTENGQIRKNKVYTDGNTTKDSNGNLKAASPIVKVFADHIETNDDSEGVELEKLGTGRYKLKGTLGMHPDASWGGIHGGIVIPGGINRLPLIWGDFEVLEDGDIIIESRFRDHQLPPPMKEKRLETYPEFRGLKDYDLCDIPNGHWVDVRVNMPSNSIYNLKKAEAERLAKEEADRQAEEEAKNAEIEAEEDI